MKCQQSFPFLFNCITCLETKNNAPVQKTEKEREKTKQKKRNRSRENFKYRILRKPRSNSSSLLSKV